MENEIKKLIEKYNRENIAPLLSAVPIWIVIRDLESLLRLYQSQKVVVDGIENEIIVSLTGIDNRTDFKREIENLYKKYVRK